MLNPVRRDVDAVHYRFGHFLLQPDRRCLSAAGVPVSVSTRAFDLLTLLVEQHDRVVTKDEILAAVWAGSIVEENNLAVQVSALRRVLGTEPDGGQYIMTVPGRGYRFVAPLEDDAAPLVDMAMPAVALAAAARRRWPTGWLVGGFTLLLLLLAGLAWSLMSANAPSAPRLSIVVLPFRNLGGDPQQDYLADAISDDVSTDLSHLPGSVVIARESAETFKGRAVRAEAIGRALNVRYLLHGSLMREGAGLHVNVQLIDAADERQLWASGFDVAQDALGTARNAIVRHLAVALDFTLVQIESARSLHERPSNADAVDDLLQARSLLDHDENLPDLVSAQLLLEHAVALVPNYGDAQALLAMVLLRKIGGFVDVDDWHDHAAAERAVSAAIAASPLDPMALTARGTLAWLDEHYERAEPDFRLALSLDPDNLAASDGLARCLNELGRMQEMIATLQAVLRIDPAAPGNAPRQNMIGMGLLMLGKPAEALPWLERARADVPAASARRLALGWQEWNRVNLIAAAAEVGEVATATSEYASYVRLWPHRTIWQLGSYYNHARDALPGQAAYRAALQKIGMPFFADEYAAFKVAPTLTPPDNDDFDPTPLSIPGGTRVDSTAVAALLAKGQALVLDVGRGAATIPGAILVWPQGTWGDQVQLLIDATTQQLRPPGSPVVVMGDGPFGWTSYAAALTLVAHGVQPVLWYRGGEEAWVASGRLARDKRP